MEHTSKHFSVFSLTFKSFLSPLSSPAPWIRKHVLRTRLMVVCTMQLRGEKRNTVYWNENSHHRTWCYLQLQSLPQLGSRRREQYHQQNRARRESCSQPKYLCHSTEKKVVQINCNIFKWTDMLYSMYNLPNYFIPKFKIFVHNLY